MRLHSLGTSLGGVDLWSVASLVLVRRCARGGRCTCQNRHNRSAQICCARGPTSRVGTAQSRCELFESSDQSRDGIINQTPQRLPRTQLAIRYIIFRLYPERRSPRADDFGSFAFKTRNVKTLQIFSFCHFDGEVINETTNHQHKQEVFRKAPVRGGLFTRNAATAKRMD